jgi:hypothetical protein
MTGLVVGWSGCSDTAGRGRAGTLFGKRCRRLGQESVKRGPFRPGALTGRRLKRDGKEAAAARARADQLRARAELLSVEVEAADVDTELVVRLASVMRPAAGKADDQESVAAMRAALGTVFSSLTFSPGAASCEGTYVTGGWVWGMRASHSAPVRTDRVRSGRG